MEEVGAFGWDEAVEKVADALDEGVDGARRLLPHPGFELGERHLDGVHVGAIGRQVEDLRSPLSDSLADTGHFMRRESVEHHDIPALEGRREDMSNIGSEGIAIHRSVKHPGCGHSRQSQASDERHCFPVPEGRAIAAALTDRCPAIEPGHLRVDARLIKKDEALRVDEGLGCPPQLATYRHVRPILFGCAQGFF